MQGKSRSPKGPEGLNTAQGLLPEERPDIILQVTFMLGFQCASRWFGLSRWPLAQVKFAVTSRAFRFGLGSLLFFSALPARAVILWSDLGPIRVHETGPGADLLGGAVKRDEASNDTLYF